MLSTLIYYMAKFWIWFNLEIADYGYPQKTDTAILKTFITQQGIKTQASLFSFQTYEWKKKEIMLFKDHYLLIRASIWLVHFRFFFNRPHLIVPIKQLLINTLSFNCLTVITVFFFQVMFVCLCVCSFICSCFYNWAGHS